MKVNLITLLISSAVLMVAVWVRQTSVFGPSMHGRYYVSAILTISCILTVITLFRWLRHSRQRSTTEVDADREPSDRPRQHYRMQFDESPYPIFVQNDERHPAAEFSCSVRNISETGISLGCTGVYANGHTVQGEIIFGSGRTAPINGVVIREEKDRTCLRLHCTIDPPLLMAEQREQIAREKGDSPRPAVCKTVLGTMAGPLPSHSPKGICRLKRQ